VDGLLTFNTSLQSEVKSSVYSTLKLITKELVERINFLARKQRNGGLTPQEKEEQKELRERYLENIRRQVVDALESAGYKPKDEKHDVACGCDTCLERGHGKLH